MKKRAFFLISLICVFTAFFLHGASLRHVANALKLHAQSVKLTGAERSQLRAEADRHLGQSSPLEIAGLLSAVASAACVAVSHHRKEPAWRSITVAFLIGYVMFLCILV